MPLSPYLRAIRDRVGNDLVLLPSVAVLPWDADGRLLLVHAIESGMWQTVGGAVEPDESPRDAAVREAAEETGAAIEIVGIRDVIGGPAFRITYPNGDRVSYVSTVFDASVIGGALKPDGHETDDVRWFERAAVRGIELTDFTVALFDAVGIV